MKQRGAHFIDGKPFNIFIGLVVLTIWGATYVIIRVTVRDNPPTIPPLSLAFMRFLVAYVVLRMIPLREKAQPSREENRTLILMGLTGITIYFYLDFTGMIYTTATNASILITLVPVLTQIGAAVFFGRRFSWINYAGFPIAFVCGALIVWNGKVNFQLNPKGDILILLSAVSWTAYTIIGGEISAKYPAVLVSRRMAAVGVVSFFPFFVMELASGKLAHVTWIALAGVVFMGVISTAVAITLWIRCIDKLGMVLASNLLYLQSVVTILIANLTIGEPVTWLLVVSTAGVVFGVYLSNLPVKKTAASVSEPKH